MEQKWFGWIEQMNEESFDVRLKDLTPENLIGENSGTDEAAEIPYTDISEKDRETIGLGSTFYWTINENSSTIEFVKPPSEDEKRKKDEMSKRFYQSILNSNLFK